MSSLCCCLHIRPRFAHRHQLNGGSFSADNSNQEAEGHSPWRFEHRFLLCPGQNVAATAKAADRADLPLTVLSLGIVAALHELSAILYAQGGHLPRRRSETMHIANVSLQGISGESSLIISTLQVHKSPGLTAREDAGSCCMHHTLLLALSMSGISTAACCSQGRHTAR